MGKKAQTKAIYIKLNKYVLISGLESSEVDALLSRIINIAELKNHDSMIQRFKIQHNTEWPNLTSLSLYMMQSKLRTFVRLLKGNVKIHQAQMYPNIGDS